MLAFRTPRRPCRRARATLACGVALLLPLAGASASTPAAGAAPPAPTCTLPPGRSLLPLTSGGRERAAVVYRPPTADPGTALPVVLTLHGSESTAAEQLQRSGLERAADRHGFLLLAPQGLLPAGRGYRWNVPGVTPVEGNVPDDEAFLSDLIREVTSSPCGDPARVYATGYSGGGRMVSQYACDVPGVLAAIAPVAGLRAGVPHAGPPGPGPDPASCQPGRAVPVLTFHGTGDRFNPYAGGGAPYWGYGTEAALARWATLNGCPPTPTTQRVTRRVRRVSYAPCREGASVEAYVIEGGGHTWPGRAAAFRGLEGTLGRTTVEIDANELIWQFFRSRRLPAP